MTSYIQTPKEWTMSTLEYKGFMVIVCSLMKHNVTHRTVHKTAGFVIVSCQCYHLTHSSCRCPQIPYTVLSWSQLSLSHQYHRSLKVYTCMHRPHWTSQSCQLTSQPSLQHNMDFQTSLKQFGKILFRHSLYFLPIHRDDCVIDCHLLLLVCYAVVSNVTDVESLVTWETWPDWTLHDFEAKVDIIIEPLQLTCVCHRVLVWPIDHQTSSALGV